MSNNQNDSIQEIYIDGVGFITFLGGVVRMDLIRVIPSPPTENDKPSPEQPSRAKIAQRLILSLQGFLQSVDAMNKLVIQLRDAGVLHQQEAPKKTEKSPLKRESK